MAGDRQRAAGPLRAAKIGRTPPVWLRYAFAFFVVGFGWAARSVLSRWIGPSDLPYISFFPAVVA